MGISLVDSCRLAGRGWLAVRVELQCVWGGQEVDKPAYGGWNVVAEKRVLSVTRGSAKPLCAGSIPARASSPVNKSASEQSAARYVTVATAVIFAHFPLTESPVKQRGNSALRRRFFVR